MEMQLREMQQKFESLKATKKEMVELNTEWTEWTEQYKIMNEKLSSLEINNKRQSDENEAMKLEYQHNNNQLAVLREFNQQLQTLVESLK